MGHGVTASAVAAIVGSSRNSRCKRQRQGADQQSLHDVLLSRSSLNCHVTELVPGENPASSAQQVQLCWLGSPPREKDVEISIRRAAAEDAQIVCAFIRELAEYERLEPECFATPEALTPTLFAAAPRVFCDIAETAGSPAGFALWFYSYSTFQAKHGIYLEDLFVRPQLRGKGLGKALMLELARCTLREGCGRFEWSVLDWNEPSIDFYRSLGARAMKDWTVFRLEGRPLERLVGG